MKLESNYKIMMKLFFLALVSSVAFLNSVCTKNKDSSNIDTTKTNIQVPFTKQGEVYFQGKTRNLIKQIDVEIAETEEKRHLGLMFRQKLEENQGMLFIFQDEEEQGFYMKNTIISLDIIFVNSKKQIVKIHKNTTPYSTRTLPSVKPALYVVEVIAGFTDKFGVKEGDYIDWRKF